VNILGIELWWESRPSTAFVDTPAGGLVPLEAGAWLYNLLIDSFGTPRAVVTAGVVDTDHGPSAWPWDVLRALHELEGMRYPIGFAHSIILLNESTTVHNFSVLGARQVP